MTLGKKLFGGFSAVLVLLIILACVSNYAISTSDSENENLLKTEVAIRHYAMETSESMLLCRRREKDFRLRLDMKYLGKHAAEYEKLKSNAHTLVKLTNNYPQMQKKASNIEKHAGLYRKLFVDVVNSYEKKGLKHNKGLQGEFRGAAHKLSGYMKQHDVADLQVGFLQIRRYEKDFQRTESAKYKVKWDKARKTYRKLLESSNCEATAKQQQIEGLDGYEAELPAYFEAIDENREEKHKIYDRIRGIHAKKIGKAISTVFIPDAEILLLTMRKHEKDYLLREDKKYQAKLHKTALTLKANFAKAVESGLKEEFASNVAALIDHYLSDFDNLVKETDNLRNLLKKMSDEVHAIEPLITELDEASDSAISKAQQETSQHMNTLLSTVIAIGIIAVILGIAISIIITNMIRKPIITAKEFAETISSGVLDKQIEVATKDEIGSLCSSLNQMAESLKRNKIDLDEKVKTQEHLISEITAISDQVSTGASEVSSSSEALSQASTEQAASLEEISSSITDVASQTVASSSTAQEVQSISTQLSSTATKGNERMNDMSEAMTEINSSSERIQKIINVIDDIAFQTNLLALNAAVEAARAGVHGKGFAVVAEEVRNLAGRSSKAAAETAGLIEESVNNVTNGVNSAKLSKEAFAEISEGIVKAESLVNKIAEATEQQSLSIGQIQQGLSQIGDTTQVNAAMSEELASSSKELSSQSDNLQQLVDQPKTTSSAIAMLE